MTNRYPFTVYVAIDGFANMEGEEPLDQRSAKLLDWMMGNLKIPTTYITSARYADFVDFARQAGIPSANRIAGSDVVVDNDNRFGVQTREFHDIAHLVSTVEPSVPIILSAFTDASHSAFPHRFYGTELPLLIDRVIQLEESLEIGPSRLHYMEPGLVPL